MRCLGALPKGRQQEQRIKLDHDCRTQSETTAYGLPAEAEEERERQKGDHGGVEVTAGAELPYAERAPCVKNDLFAAAADEFEQPNQGEDGEALEADHGQLHDGERAGDGGNEEEDHLRHGWIDGGGIIAAVDVGEDVFVAEGLEVLVAGEVVVGVKAVVLHDAIPDVAVDVGGEVGLGHEEGEPAENGKDDDDPKGPAINGLQEGDGSGAQMQGERAGRGFGVADNEVVELDGEVVREAEEH